MRDRECEDEDVGDQVKASDSKNEFAIGETVHGDCDVPCPVVDIAKSNNCEECDAIVDGAVGKQRIYHVSELRLELENS